MKIEISNVKKWTILNVDWVLYKVIDTSHTHTWRGSATYWFRVKNIITWNSNNLSYKAWTVLEQAEVNTNSAIYLYNSWDTYSFMENDTSEMFELDRNEIEDIIPYLKENLDVYLMIYEGNVLWVILPNTITYKIAETVPWVKWDRASAWKKPAKTETWLDIMVPLHLEEGAEVTVNTTTWEVI